VAEVFHNNLGFVFVVWVIEAVELLRNEKTPIFFLVDIASQSFSIKQLGYFDKKVELPLFIRVGNIKQRIS
jgi:hypothetical protein